MTPAAESIRVWDPLVRILHWLLVSAVVLAWISTLGWGLSALHEPSGWITLVVVTLRIAWGFAGSGYARFRQFVRSPRTLLGYIEKMRAGSAPRYIGHNPLGGWMILVLLVTVIAIGFTGWLFTTDMFWGTAWLQTLHASLAWLLLGLVVVHVAGVIFSSLAHHENLLRAMFTGRKPVLKNTEDQWSG